MADRLANVYATGAPSSHWQSLVPGIRHWQIPVPILSLGVILEIPLESFARVSG